MKIKSKKSWIIVGLVLSLSIFAGVKAALLENVTNMQKLELGDALYFGDAQDNLYVTMPTAATADDYGVKVPFINGGAAATARGTVIISSVSASAIGTGSFAAVLATSTILGVSDGVYAVGTKGWMTIAGYCQVLTTGTVTIGQVLVTTDTVSGYAGAASLAQLITSSNTIGIPIGKAVSNGTAAGGLTTILISR